MRDGGNMITDPYEMAAHAVNYFTNIFGFAGEVQDYDLIDIIPNLAIDSMNAIVTNLPFI